MSYLILTYNINTEGGNSVPFPGPTPVGDHSLTVPLSTQISINVYTGELDAGDNLALP